MTLHIRVTRQKNLLHVHGQWDSGLPLYQNFTLRPVVGLTAAETVELALMDEGLVATWLWIKRRDGPILEGEFHFAPTSKEVSYSGADRCDLTER